jgi:hypothetical protein
MSRIFSYYFFFSIEILFYVLFYLFFILLVSGHYRLDIPLFEKIQDYEEKTLSSSKAGSKASDP